MCAPSLHPSLPPSLLPPPSRPPPPPRRSRAPGLRRPPRRDAPPLLSRPRRRPLLPPPPPRQVGPTATGPHPCPARRVVCPSVPTPTAGGGGGGSALGSPEPGEDGGGGMGGPEPCGSRWGGGGRMLFPPPTTPPRRGNAFLQPSRGTFRQAMGLAPLPRRPVATCRDGRRGCGDGGWGGGIASPPPRGSGIAEQVGPEKTASPPPPPGVTGIFPRARRRGCGASARRGWPCLRAGLLFLQPRGFVP